MYALGHFAVGATLMILILEFILTDEAWKLKHDLPLILISGGWAMLPDIAWIGYPILPHNSPLMNIFWFHQILDVLDPHDDPRYSALAYAVLCFVTVFVVLYERQVFLKQYHRRGKKISCL